MGDLSTSKASDPQLDLDTNSAFLLLGLAQAGVARELQSNPRPHEPMIHDSGFTMAISTPKGVVGVTSSWTANSLFIGYPRSAGTVADDLIAKTLGVQQLGYGLFQGPAGSIPRQVLISHSDDSRICREFAVLEKDGGLSTFYYGAGYGLNISTYDYPTHPRGEQHSMTPEAIQPYRDRFIDLAAKLADQFGGATSITVHYLDVFLPEQLQLAGFREIEWKKAPRIPGQEVPDDLVSARRNSNGPEDLIVLKRGNSAFPWTPLRRQSCAGTSAVHLKSLLYF